MQEVTFRVKTACSVEKMDRRISRKAQEVKAPPKHCYWFPSVSGELLAGHSLEMSTETLYHNPASLLPCSLGDLMQKLKARKKTMKCCWHIAIQEGIWRLEDKCSPTSCSKPSKIRLGWL